MHKKKLKLNVFCFPGRVPPVLLLLCGSLFLQGGAIQAEGESAKPDVAPEAEKKSDAKPEENPEAKSGEESEKKPEEKEESAEKKEDKPGGETVHEITESELKISSKMIGYVESNRQTPIAMDLERWTDMLVVTAVPHGTEVKAGDVLIQLDTEEIDRKIEETEEAMPLKEIEHKMAVESYEKLSKSTPLSLETATLSKEQAEEDLDYFVKVTRPMRERDVKEDLKSTSEYLAYAEEELGQLKKMYEADDLTEETEEIILRRAQNTVNEYKWMLEQTRERSDRTLKTTIPREHERLEHSLEQKLISWKSGQESLKDALEKSRLEVEAKSRSLEEAQRSLKEYKEDREKLTIKAPHDGLVYYGMSIRGKWATGVTVERKLLPGGKLTMREVVMTIVDPDDLDLRVSVAEEKLRGLSAGQKAAVTMKWNPDEELSGKIKRISRIPWSEGWFDGEIDLELEGNELELYPGMKADAEVEVYRNEKALIVPKRAVEKKDGKKIVKLEGGETVEVETGMSKGDDIEITKGLSVGQKILVPSKSAGSSAPAAKPGAKKPADAAKAVKK